MQEPNPSLYAKQLLTDTRSAVTTQTPSRNINITLVDKTGPGESKAAPKVEFPIVSGVEGFLTRHAPVFVTNYKTKQDEHATQTFEVMRQKMNELYEETKTAKDLAKKEYQTQIIETERHAQRLQSLFEAGITDPETGEYMCDEHGGRAQFEITLMDLNEVAANRELAERVYQRTLQQEQKVRKAKELSNLKFQTEANLQKIMSDLKRSLASFNLTGIQKTLDKQKDDAQDAIDMLQDATADTVDLPENQETTEETTPVQPVYVTNLLKSCQAKKLEQKSKHSIDSLRLPGQ